MAEPDDRGPADLTAPPSNTPKLATQRPQPKSIGALDALFLVGETPSTMMHVAALLRFTPPPDAPSDYLRTMIDEIRRDSVIQFPWNRKLRHPAALTTPLQQWVLDKNFDLDYHFRHSALPSPGGERELGTLVSRLHSNPLDLSRPPWEMHVIEGLEGGGFAVYSKMHHALVDGYTGMRLLQRTLPPEPDDLHTPMMFAVPPPKRPALPSQHPNLIADTWAKIASVGRGIVGAATTTADVGAAVGHYVLRGGDAKNLVSPLQAPQTILNRRIGRNRRFATAQMDLTEIKRVGHACGATVNDVCLAVLGGALRRFLSELGDLPTKPLIAFVPVNVRPENDEGGGNAVGAVLASMGTDVADPLDRVHAVAKTTEAGKAQLRGMTQAGMIAYSGALLSPATIQASLAYTGVNNPIPLAFNVIVSNVPGPKETRYFRGSRLEGMFPVSIPFHGAALNITFMGYDDTLDFGFVGDRDTIPHLQRLAVYAAEEMDAIGAAVDARSDAPHAERPKSVASTSPKRRRSARQAAAAETPSTTTAPAPRAASATKAAAPKKATAKKAAAKKTTPAKKTAAKRNTTAAQKKPAKKAATAKKTATAEKATTAKKSVPATKSTAAKKSAAPKKSAPATKSSAPQKATP
ncbi:hypothetical protein GCM10009624_17880 [Gordonia sinesedis]